ncbi:hypothetical protein PRIPAC_91572 [Pristionchus pacificus]|uniref:Uncharacterized protein n=1 Tax=Pristionchus pacificus TaxID=54126 RepID=A0A2A6BAW5_PRIPA|nr:hypothetical protein PRIPAC_91572 [Pristionchus pacificus]|eukprot:PDM62981.1 hypothetical protein PRIPAC_50196 [Pristionchus pacificus]
MSRPSTASSETEMDQVLRDADGISEVCLDRFLLGIFIILCGIASLGFAYIGYTGAHPDDSSNPVSTRLENESHNVKWKLLNAALSSFFILSFFQYCFSNRQVRSRNEEAPEM